MRNKIFQPLFTTKPSLQGAGLRAIGWIGGMDYMILRNHINPKNPPKTCPPERSAGGSMFRQKNDIAQTHGGELRVETKQGDKLSF